MRPLFILLPILLASSLVAEAAEPRRESIDEVALRIGPGVYGIGNVTLYNATRTLTIPGRVNRQSGSIKLLACAPEGKTHESLLILDVDPIHLHNALLLLDLRYGRNLRFLGDPKPPEGDPVELYVEWEDEEETIRHRAEDLVLDIVNMRTMPHTHWAFAGSRVMEGRFAASEDGTLITTYNDPNTILANPLETGAVEDIYEANPLMIPPEDTPITLILFAPEVDRRIPIFDEEFKPAPDEN